MVYKTIPKIIIFCLLPICLYSNIVYDKNEIIITEIDLDYYNQVYYENFGETQNDFEAIKNIVVIKKFIDNFKKNNPLFLKKIDEILVNVSRKNFDKHNYRIIKTIKIIKKFFELKGHNKNL